MLTSLDLYKTVRFVLHDGIGLDFVHRNPDSSPFFDLNSLYNHFVVPEVSLVIVSELLGDLLTTTPECPFTPFIITFDLFLLEALRCRPSNHCGNGHRYTLYLFRGLLDLQGRFL